MYSLVNGPEITQVRQSEFVLIDGSAEVQELGCITRKVIRIYWASSAEINAIIGSAQDEGWVLDGDVSPSAVQYPLDIYNTEIPVHKHFKQT